MNEAEQPFRSSHVALLRTPPAFVEEAGYSSPGELWEISCRAEQNTVPGSRGSAVTGAAIPERERGF